jgi:hypothetical protein
VHLPTGEAIDVRPIGQDAGFEVNWYVFGVLGAQVDRAEVTVYDRNGRELR